MAQLALRVENVGKQYRLSHVARTNYKTFREAISWRVAMLTEWIRRKPGAALAARQTSDFWALRDVSFEVEEGEVVAIIGRNGAGKSTLLKVLSRITKPTTGRVTLYGRVGSLLEVGTGFHPELTGRENIYLNGAILGMRKSEIARQFDEIVAFAEVEQFLDMPVKRYSSGMHVRLAFAVAAHLNPEILLIDEVLAVGDAAFQRKCMGKMNAVSQSGRTVLFVSHNMAAIRELCTKAILLDHGVVERQGPVDEIVAYYLETMEERSTFQLAGGARNISSGAVLDSFTLRDLDGHPVTEVRADRGFLAEFTVSCFEPAISDVSMQFTIYDAGGLALAHFNNLHHGVTVNLTHGITRIQCRIPSIPLRTGFYLVNLGLFKGHQAFSHVKNALSVSILNDGLAPGVILPVNAPPVLVAQTWEAVHLDDAVSATGEASCGSE